MRFVLKKSFYTKKKKGLFGGSIKSMKEIQAISKKIQHQEALELSKIEAEINAELTQIK